VKSHISADLSQKHARSKLNTTTVNQPIVRKPHLFNEVDFTRLLLFFRFLFHFPRFDQPTVFVSFRSLRKPRSTEEKLVIKGPVDPALGLTVEKPENGLGPKINATARLSVTSAAIRG
jgi:hypothetical protein